MESRVLTIAPFLQSSELISDIKTLVTTGGYESMFKAIIVHGSVAVGEVISYSDFDGLLIVKDQYKESQQLKRFKKESMAIILKFDPLQHHGWFQISESNLDNYSETYLPFAVLERSKLVFPVNREISLTFKTSETNFSDGVSRMVKGLLKKTQSHWRPSNIYQLKSFLSEVMLLPALVFADHYDQAIFKKESFEEARPLFTDAEWSIIEQASSIRSNWSYKLTWLQRWFMTRPSRISRKLTQKYVAPAIPPHLVPNEKFYFGLEELLIRLRNQEPL